MMKKMMEMKMKMKMKMKMNKKKKNKDKDKNIYKYLKETVITQELIEKLASGIDFSQAISQDNKVLEESILTLLRLFTIELKE